MKDTKERWGNMTVKEVCELCKKMEAKKIILTFGTLGTVCITPNGIYGKCLAKCMVI